MRVGVPVAGVQKTTNRTFTVEGEEKNECFVPASAGNKWLAICPTRGEMPQDPVLKKIKEDGC
jgi:hypothetical protein